MGIHKNSSWALPWTPGVWRVIVCLLLVLQLWSCSAGGFGWNTPSQTQLAPVDYFIWLQEADPDTLMQERLRLENIRSSGSGLIATVQLALMLSLTGDAVDLSVAHELFDTSGAECYGINQCRAYQAFGDLWYERLQVRLELQAAQADLELVQARLAQTNLQNQELLAQTNSQNQELLARSDSQNQELLARIKSLEEQIEALTSIEQQLIDREQPQVQQ